MKEQDSPIDISPLPSPIPSIELITVASDTKSSMESSSDNKISDLQQVLCQSPQHPPYSPFTPDVRNIRTIGF